MKKASTPYPFLTINLTLLVWVIFSLSTPFLLEASTSEKTEKPLAVKGLLDLTPLNLYENGPITLKGEWEMYWQKLLDPDYFSHSSQEQEKRYFHIPSVWNGYPLGNNHLTGKGYATFRLKVKLNPTSDMLAFQIPRVFTAYRLWVDDKLVTEVGKVGTTRESMIPRFKSPIVHFQTDADEFFLTLQISNFMHSRGGIRQNIKLGTKDQIDASRSFRVVIEAVLIGALLIMSLYHLALFALRKEDVFNLYFSLICLLFMFRTAFTGEVVGYWIIQDANWHLITKLEWLSVFVAPSLAVGFFQTYFPQEGSKRVKQIAIAVGLALGVMVLASPPILFTTIFHYITPLIIGLLSYGIFILIKAFIHGRQGALVISIAYAVAFVATVNDVLHASEIIKTGFYLSYSLLIFIVTQSVQLSIRASQAMRRVETQAVQLARTNRAYEDEIREKKRAEAEVKAYQERLEVLVAERTEALEIANKRLREELVERQLAEKEKEKLRYQLQRAQKMEAIGTLAGGVAHDLNNILSGLVGYPELILMDLPQDSKLRPFIEIMLKSGKKAAAIVQDLLTLARRGIQEMVVLNLNDVIHEYLDSPEFEKLLQFHEGVRIDTHLEPALLNIKGSAIHLSKTVMNLVSNAAEALSNDGTIHIATRNQYLDTPLAGYELTQPGDYAVMEIVDTGVGMGNDEVERIFDPFYSKKKMGRSGTGLGMAVVWGTVKDHQGYINIKSEPSEGTTLTLFFPITREVQRYEVDASDLSMYQGQGQTVLVVDDMSEQRQVASTMLEKLGYRVTTVSSGEEAVTYIKDNQVDILLLDMIMDPGIDGLETYRRILETKPHQKAIIASGYSETARVHTAQALGAGEYVKKPYTLINIARAISQELNK
jgi:two-component system, cell cycle sensor histidine kinase and response regulator CckA